jgi:putative transposase
MKVSFAGYANHPVNWAFHGITDWAESVNQSISAVELDRLHESVNRGRPFGSERWRRASAARLGLESTLRKPGRPRKIADKMRRPEKNV